MDKRTLLAIVLSLAVLLIYQMFFVKPPQPKQVPAGAGDTGQVQPKRRCNQLLREKRSWKRNLLPKNKCLREISKSKRLSIRQFFPTEAHP